MTPETRRVIHSGTVEGSGNDTWETPPAVFADLHDTYGFDIDLFADPVRTLLPAWFGRGVGNALELPWHQAGEFGYANPPYGSLVPKVLAKAAAEAECGFSTLLLLPFRMTKAMRWAIFQSGNVAKVLVCDRRITFYENGEPRRDKQGRPSPAPFDSVLVLFRPGVYHQAEWVEYAVPKHA